MGGGIADLTLSWMVQSIRDFGLGLEFDQPQINQLQPNVLKPQIPDLYAARRRWQFPFLSILGLKIREIPDQPTAENQQRYFHPSVSVRWCNNPDYRPKALLDQGWRSVFDAGCQG